MRGAHEIRGAAGGKACPPRCQAAANRAKRIESCTLEEVADIDNLYRCARDCAHGVAWKSAVQRYLANILPNVLKTHADLMAGKDIRRGFVEFDIFERGKLRHITSVHYSERVVHKALNRYALAPAIWPTLAPGCTANIKGRGNRLCRIAPETAACTALPEARRRRLRAACRFL